jgi:hypothetical protein
MAKTFPYLTNVEDNKIQILPMLRIKRLFHSLPIAHGVQVSPQNDDHIRMRSLEINKNILSLPFSIIILFRYPHR